MGASGLDGVPKLDGVSKIDALRDDLSRRNGSSGRQIEGRTDSVGAIARHTTHGPASTPSAAIPAARSDTPSTAPRSAGTREPEARGAGSPGWQAVSEAAAKLNDTASAFYRHVKFSVHEETDRIIARVINTQTNEVIREIPPEELLDLVAKIQRLLGLFVDEKA